MQGWSQGGAHSRPSSQTCPRNDTVANSVLFLEDPVGTGAPGPGSYHVQGSLSTRKVEHRHQSESAAFRKPFVPKLKARVQQIPTNLVGDSSQSLQDISVGATAAASDLLQNSPAQHNRCATADAIIRQHTQRFAHHPPFNSHVRLELY